MNIRRHSLIALLVTFTAALSFPARAADDSAVLARMSGNYRDSSVIYRVQEEGSADDFAAGIMSLRLPRKKGAMGGRITVPGISYALTGNITKATVRAGKVQYQGRLRLVSTGVSLSQPNFRATASPKGRRSEALACGVKLSGTTFSGLAILSANFRGSK